MLRAFLAIGIVAVLLPGLPGTVTAQTPYPTKTLRGIVVDEQGKPVAGASVGRGLRVIKDFKRAQTDADGKFALEISLNGAQVTVVASSSDDAFKGMLNLPSKETEWKDDEVQVVIKTASAISVKVVGADGAPVSEATVGALVRYPQMGHEKLTAKTNADGVATWRVLPGGHSATFLAFKPDAGLDYVNFGSEQNRDDVAPVMPKDVVVMKLEGVRSYPLSAVDDDGKPVANVRISPFTLHKPAPNQRSQNYINLSYFADELSQVTDEQGKATIHWLPKWAEFTTFFGRLEGYSEERLDIDLQLGSPPNRFTMLKLITIAGKVVLPDGKPAEGTMVTVAGDGYALEGFHRGATTDASGSFSFKAPPHFLCMIGARQGTLVAKSVQEIVTAPGKSIEGVTLTLEPGIRLHGKVTTGPNKTPQANSYIMVQELGVNLLSLPHLSIPNPEKSRRSVAPQLVQNLTTDENGEFEAILCAGDYVVRVSGEMENYEKFSLTTETEKVVDFHSALPKSLAFAGITRSAVDQSPVAGANIAFAYESPNASSFTETTSDAEGRFRVERAPYSAQVFAISADGKLADLQAITDSQPSIDFSMRPTAILKGRAIDGATGQPYADKQITYGVRITMTGQDGFALFSTRFGKRIRTDKDGYFETGPVATEVESEVTIQPDNSGMILNLAKVKPDKGGVLDLGELKTTPPRKPETTMDRVLKVFNRSDSAVERFEKALKDGKLSRQRIAIFFASPEEAATKELMTLRFEDNELSRALDPFLFMVVDLRGEAMVRAKALAERLKLEGELSSESPRLVIFDLEETKLADVLSAKQFVHNGKFDKLKMIDMLDEHRPEPLDAQKLLDDTLAQAKREGKHVLVQETATWCGPCWMLSRFLDKHRATWEKDIIWVKMDHRWTGAIEIMTKMRAGAGGGVPWCAILDEDGKVVITSNRASDGNNFGFPSEEESRPHFKAMMQKAARRMTEKEIEAMTKDLAKSE